MGRLPRPLIFAAIVVVLALVASAGLSVGAVRRSFPELEGTIALPGLTAPVEVLRDEHGVPQIYADHAEDLLEAQGYLHAQDRFWEMDVRRHITAGRLSELFGDSQVTTDSYLRTLGLHAVAEQELALLSSSTRRYLDAYASGVNSYLRGRSAGDLSLEYTVLGLQGLDYTPEPWTAADSVSWLKAMAWNLGANLEQERDQALLTTLVGAQRAAELYPDHPLEGYAPIVRRGQVVDKAFDPTAAAGDNRPVPTLPGSPATDASKRDEAGKGSSGAGPGEASADEGSSGTGTSGTGTSGGSTPGGSTPGKGIPGKGIPGSDARETTSDADAQTAALTALDGLTAAVGPWLAPGAGSGALGSNSWVVSGRHTASGKAMLSNDPHLATSIPSVFTQVGLHCRVVATQCPFDVAGFSLAGVPGVVIGHNASIAWGFTTSYLDQQDLYLEQLQGDAARVADSYEPLTVRTEQIRVAGADEPRTIRVRSSRHGPLLSDVDQQVRQVGLDAGTQDETAAYAVALSWAALTPGRTMDGLIGLNTATDFTAFRAAAKLVSAPSQNLVYADTAGHIGYQLAGSVPERGRGDGRVPAPGWDSRYDWQGTLPFEEQPYEYDPPSGIIVAANQPIVGRQYPYPLGSNYSYGWRSQELLDDLTDAGELTADSAEQLFYDDTIRFAADLVPLLLRIKIDDAWVAEGQQTLVGWDYSAAADSAAAAYFTVVFHDILKRTFRDDLPETLWPAGGDRWFAVVSRLLEDPSNRWWDDQNTPDVRERRNDILLAAMTDARKELTSLMARDTDEWQWGRLHRVTLRNETLGRSGIGPVEKLFNRGDLPVAGGPAVVNAMGYDDRVGYRVTSGPTMRMLVDLADLDGSRWVNQSGVSGHAYAAHYDDQLPLWAANRTWPFVFSRPAVEAATEYRLQLTPSG